MELKLGRLLRFDPGYLCRSFIYTPGIYSFELTAAIISNHCTLHDRETLKRCVGPGTFLMDNIRSSKLPPRGWYHLMKNARVFRPLDPDDDNHANTFPLHLCSAILHSFKESKTPKRDFNSPLVLSFKDALPFFLEHIYNDVLRMFSKFVDPSIDKLPLRQRVFVTAIKFLLHRLTLPNLSDASNNDIHNSISAALLYIQRSTSSEEATVFIPVLEDIMLPCVVPPFNTSPLWNSIFWYIIDPYRSLASIAPSACSLRGPQSVVDLMTSRWDEANKVDSDVACGVLSDLLSKHIPAAYTVFREQCLQFLGSHAFHGASVSMVSAYIAGISDGAVDDATLRQHIDNLCNPHNRFAACSILATHDISSIDRTAIHRDIATLVRLCPTRDAAWDECCRRLHDLVQSDGGGFFTKQRAVFDDCRPLRTDEIQVEKENIKYAIQVLDDCLNGRAPTMDPVPSDSSPVPHAAGHIDRFVGWCRRRKLDGKLEEKLEV
ncbi:hypothetical protein EDD85DRAFT_867996 [Armillaria nabsnona]|nr:hypothetical protein EDD85DRAFT_867996 [Armillaria nabsnona]